MDPHLLANPFKRSNYDEPIASEFCALDYLYEALLEIRESENYDEEIYEEIHDSSLNKKHDCNDFTMNYVDVNCANNMQNPKLGDACFVKSVTHCNDHDWVMMILMILKIYLNLMMNMLVILLKVGSERS